MDNEIQQVSSLLHQAAETHHVVFAISDGDDPDWASWYADWPVNLSNLATVLGSRPVRSELTFLLVTLDKEFTRDKPGQPWVDFYAARLLQHFASGR
jgi:hypothetical protein